MTAVSEDQMDRWMTSVDTRLHDLQLAVERLTVSVVRIEDTLKQNNLIRDDMMGKTIPEFECLKLTVAAHERSISNVWKTIRWVGGTLAAVGIALAVEYLKQAWFAGG